MKSNGSAKISARFDRIVNYLVYTGTENERPAYVRYGLPLIAIVIVTLLKLNFNEAIGINSPFLLFNDIVCFAAIIGGVRPAIMAAVISAKIDD